jgi:hypothetical protein
VAGLQNQTGTIVDVRTTHFNGREHVPNKETNYLVRFDPPLPPLWEWGSPCTGYWLEESELVNA